MVDELIRRFILDQPTKTIGVISVDPSKRKTGGALLGDRIRMNSIRGERVYMRSLATRQSNLALSKHVKEAVDVLKGSRLRPDHPGDKRHRPERYGDPRPQRRFALYHDAGVRRGHAAGEDRHARLRRRGGDQPVRQRGALDAVRDVKKQYKRNHQLWDADDDTLPVVGTIASQFNDPGTNVLYARLMQKIAEKTGTDFKSTFAAHDEMSEKVWIIPPAKSRYLSEISENNRRYDAHVRKQAGIADRLYGPVLGCHHLRWTGSLEATGHGLRAAGTSAATANVAEPADQPAARSRSRNPHHHIRRATQRPGSALVVNAHGLEDRRGEVQWRVLHLPRARQGDQSPQPHREPQSPEDPKVALPKFRSWGDKVRWAMQENTPGFYPYTAGIYPFKRTGEDPARMFAGEGGPERTNKRFHYVSQGLPAKRLSTAFDSVTLYGHDPGRRPDIYGKVGNSGVSICCLDDAKKLYSGFDLTSPTTSVSMTINGPAPMLLGFFMNAAIDQNCEKYIREHGLEAEVEKKIAERWEKVRKANGEWSMANGGLGATQSPTTTDGPGHSHSPTPIHHSPRPRYNGEIPTGNDGLGLMLLGVTGDQVLPADIYAKIKADTLAQVRGTVQADILKEDQAQNTCIFSTEFALRA